MKASDLWRAFAAVGMIVLTAVGACATAGAQPAGGPGGVAAEVENEVVVQVQNNLIPPTSLSVWIVPDVGGRQLLGTVRPSATAMLGYDPATASGEYRLLAETTEGNDIASNPFTVTDAAVVTWDVTANLATVTEQQPE